MSKDVLRRKIFFTKWGQITILSWKVKKIENLSAGARVAQATRVVRRHPFFSEKVTLKCKNT